jgi:hypothetical protein
VLTGLLEHLQPAHVLAVGRKAEHALKQLDVEAAYIRHPSHGGVNTFKRTILAYFQENDICPFLPQKP